MIPTQTTHQDVPAPQQMPTTTVVLAPPQPQAPVTVESAKTAQPSEPTMEQPGGSVDEPARKGPGTASEQGLQITPEEERRLAAIAAAAEVANTPMQRGEVVDVYAPSGVAGVRQLQGWLGNWEARLTCIGIPQEKVAFEAKRLSQTAFQQWASRMVWEYDPQQVCVCPQ